MSIGMQIFLVICGIVGICVLSVYLSEIARRGKPLAMIVGSFWLFAIVGIMNYYKFTVINFLKYWGLSIVFILIVNAYANYVHEGREKIIISLNKELEDLKEKENLAEKEQKKLKKIEKKLSIYSQEWNF